jgi:hypothetical protein
MGIRLRLTLLTLTGIFGTTPPSRPPGSRRTSDKAVCPTCGRTSTTKVGNQFYCRLCDEWFVP